MRHVSGRFLKSTGGSFAPVFAISLVPLVLAVGMSVDYTSAVSTRSSMQNALDAATLALTTMDRTATDTQRQNKLQDTFSANGGKGAATLKSTVFDSDGTMHASATASYSMPTNFMNLAMIDSVPISVATSVVKNPGLVLATFNVDVVSGWWDKTVTLYGKKSGETKPTKLMQIDYAHNRYGDPKGYGTTTLSKLANNAMSVVQTKKCTTKSVNNFNSAKADDIQETASNGSKYLITCTTTTDPSAKNGAEIDVSQMDSLYLQMDIPNPNPGLGGGKLDKGTLTTLKSNDPATSDRLFYEANKQMIQIPKGTAADIFGIVPCGQTSTQAWEDGGSLTNKADDADFRYKVSGKCDFTKRPSALFTQ